MNEGPLEVSKPARERQIFGLFAEDVGMPVVPGSVVSREPPEPDILCEVNGRGLVAFELVEVVHQGFREGMEVRGRTDELLATSLSEFPARASLFEKYADAWVWLRFHDFASLRKREAALPEIFRWLLEEVPIGLSEPDVDVPERFAEILWTASIDRPRYGPRFECGHAASITDPTLATIQRKLRSKKYETEHPQELLAYTVVHALMPNEVWQLKYAQPLRDMLDGTKFSRLWVWALSQRGQEGALKLVHPPLP